MEKKPHKDTWVRVNEKEKDNIDVLTGAVSSGSKQTGGGETYTLKE